MRLSARWSDIKSLMSCLPLDIERIIWEYTIDKTVYDKVLREMEEQNKKEDDLDFHIEREYTTTCPKCDRRDNSCYCC